MKTVCVFAGSSSGIREVHADGARMLGRAIAARGAGLVYGGGATGLMGILADAVIGGGGNVTGVIPGSLVDRELAHHGVTRLEVVVSMHERKARMAELSDVFVALPGGIGTLEELMEIWTWSQLGIHAKPCGIVDAGGYYGPLLAMIDRMVGEGFLPAADRDLVLVDRDPGKLLDRLGDWVATARPRWMDPRQV